MKWKIIIGIALIYGGIKEFAFNFEAYKTDSGSYPIYALLGCMTFMFLGMYLIYKGRQKKQL